MVKGKNENRPRAAAGKAESQFQISPGLFLYFLFRFFLPPSYKVISPIAVPE